MTTTTTTTAFTRIQPLARVRCPASSRSFSIPEGLDLRGKQVTTCPECSRKVYVSRWNSIKQTMIIAMHKT